MPRVVISGASGGLQPRKDIYEFVTDIKQFSLFVQALADLENMPWEEQLSFFALGGIHGYPYVPWGGDSGKPGSTAGTEKQEQWEGYCTHGTVLFPTWHRPYVAAVEQFVYDHAVEKAKEYTGPDASQWAEAARTLRMPYWDWANQALPPPEVIEYQTVNIVNPQGDTISVPNPLYQFVFKESVKDFPGLFSLWQKTLRHPTSHDPSAESDVEDLKKTLNANYEQTRMSIYRLLTLVHNWPDFSNHTTSDNPYVSLEGVHDNIHNFIGGLGGGHMASVPVAGFDPIFYLHHCNVDRVLSIWSSLNPQVWVSPGDSEDGTITIPPHVAVDEHTDLTPFANTQTSYWPSSQLTSTDVLGYTFPEVIVETGKETDARREIAKRIETLYGAPASRTNHSFHDWTVRVRVKEFALGESFHVLVFLGAVPPVEDHKNWMAHPNYVGCVSAFVNEIPEACANCAARPDKVIQGIVYLSETIAERSGLPGSLDPEMVSPYLEEKLNWSIQKVMSGVPVAVEDVPSLEVTVFSTLLTKREGATFPTMGDHVPHHRITRGKIGGHRVTDEEA